VNTAVVVEHDEDRGLVSNETADIDPIGDNHRGVVTGREPAQRVGVVLSSVVVRAIGQREIDTPAGGGGGSAPIEQAGGTERGKRGGDAVGVREHRVEAL